VSDAQAPLAIVVGAGVLAIAAVLIAREVRARRRAAQSNRPFNPEWRTLLEHSLPLYGRIPPALRLRLEPIVRRFLSDVDFVGCQGLEVTDEMRLIIGLQACLLIVERDPRAYESMRSVLIYPDEFVVADADEDESGVVTEGEQVLSGQTVDTARVVLSWRDVQKAGVEGDVYNVVLHEFAHYLDHTMDGALTDTSSRRKAFEAWHGVLAREYEALCAALERGDDTLIDPYGAEHPAEFFAVATETFFEEPGEMRRRHPQLYGELRRFYGLDPGNW
jgi:Mlc titration factor MtfA (ptsG expression regulator)